MRSPVPPDEWLGASNDKVAWVIEHIENKVGRGLPHPHNKETALAALQHIWQGGRGADDFARIKRAWNSYRYKKSSGKRTFSFVLPVEVARQLKGQAKLSRMSQSGYLAALIRGDGIHLTQLKEAYERKKAKPDPPKNRSMLRLRAENDRKSAIISQYEELIAQLVEKDLLRTEFQSSGFDNKSQLNNDQRLALREKADKLVSAYLGDARLDATALNNQDKSDSLF